MEWYYRKNHPEYNPPKEMSRNPMEFIYPESGVEVRIPRLEDGKPGEMVFSLAHRYPETRVYWHFDGRYLGETAFIHQYSMSPEPGRHTMTVTDDKGNTVSTTFTVAARE